MSEIILQPASSIASELPPKADSMAMSKEDLENLRLSIETRVLKNPWRDPALWFSAIMTLLAVSGFFYQFAATRAETVLAKAEKIQAECDAEKAKGELSKAREDLALAQAARDKMISDSAELLKQLEGRNAELAEAREARDTARSQASDVMKQSSAQKALLSSTKEKIDTAETRLANVRTELAGHELQLKEARLLLKEAKKTASPELRERIRQFASFKDEVRFYNPTGKFPYHVPPY